MSLSRPSTAKSPRDKDVIQPRHLHPWDLDSAHPTSCPACSISNTRGTQKHLPPPKEPDPPPETPTSSSATQTLLPAAKHGLAPLPSPRGNLAIIRRFPAVGFADDAAEPSTSGTAAADTLPRNLGRPRTTDQHTATAAAAPSARPSTAPPTSLRTASTASGAPSTSSSTLSPTRMGRPALSIGGFLTAEGKSAGHSPSSSPSLSPVRGAVQAGQQHLSPARGAVQAGQQQYANIYEEMSSRAVSPNAERGLVWVVPRTSFAEMQADWSATRQRMALDMKRLADTQRAEAHQLREVTGAVEEAVLRMHEDVGEQLARMEHEQQQQVEELRQYVTLQVDGLRQSMEALTAGLQAMCMTMAQQSVQVSTAAAAATMPSVSVNQLARAALEQMAIHENGGDMVAPPVWNPSPPPPASPAPPRVSTVTLPGGDTPMSALTLVADRVARDLRVQHNNILAPVNIAILQHTNAQRSSSSGRGRP